MSEPVEFLHLVGAQINEALGVGGPTSEAKFDHAFVGFERLAPYLGNVADVVLDLLRERGLRFRVGRHVFGRAAKTWGLGRNCLVTR